MDSTLLKKLTVDYDLIRNIKIDIITKIKIKFVKAIDKLIHLLNFLKKKIIL